MHGPRPDSFFAWLHSCLLALTLFQFLAMFFFWQVFRIRTGLRWQWQIAYKYHAMIREGVINCCILTFLVFVPIFVVVELSSTRRLQDIKDTSSLFNVCSAIEEGCKLHTQSSSIIHTLHVLMLNTANKAVAFNERFYCLPWWIELHIIQEDQVKARIYQARHQTTLIPRGPGQSRCVNCQLK